MISKRQAFLGSTLGILSAILTIAGCTRPLSIPVTPGMILTPTSTDTRTFTSTSTPMVTNTFTSTPTVTLTATATATDTGAFTATSTDTPTITPTLTDSPTWTDTPTVTDTATDTPTATATATNTSDPRVIDDVDDGDGQIKVQTDGASNVRDGYWYVYDSATNIAIGYGAAGYSGGAVNASGSLASSSAYAGVGFAFTDPAGIPNNGVSFYDGTVSGYTGISFWAKIGSQPPGICENAYPVNMIIVDSTLAEPKVALPLTTTWTQFTIYYDQFPGLDPTQIYQVKWTAVNYSGAVQVDYDLYFDQFEFVTGSNPAPPVLPPAAYIDDFEDGDNQLIVQGGRDGYWYTYADTATGPGTVLCPMLGSIGGGFYPSKNDNLVGNTSPWVARFNGGPFSTWGAGMGLNLENGTSNYDLTQGGLYTGIMFDVKAATTNAVRFKVPDNQADGSDNHGYTFNPTTGWTTQSRLFTNMPQEGWGTATTFSPQTASALQWQYGTGVAFELWVDNVRLY